MNSREKILELASITLSNESGYHIFDDLNLFLNQGETAIVVGPSAAGKTLLVEIIIGRKRPDKGEVRIFGRNLNFRSERSINQARSRIGGVGGPFDLVAGQTVGENLAYPLIIRGDTGAFRKMRLKQILTQFNLHNRERDDISRLSRGELLMAMLARAVIADQPLLLIDEPLDLLEPAVIATVRDMLKRLSAAGHSMLILTTGQTIPEIPGAALYHLREGRLQ